MTETQILRKARKLADDAQVLQALLRLLIRRGTITPADLDTVLGATVQRVLAAVRAQAMTLFMVDEATRGIRFKYVYFSPSLYGDDAEKQRLFEERAEVLSQIPLDYGQGIVGQVIERGAPALIPEAQKDARFFSTIDDVTGFVTISVLAVPLRSGDQVVGCLEVINKLDDESAVTPFTEADLSLVEDVAAYSGKAIHRALHPSEPVSDIEMGRLLARLNRCDFIELSDLTPLDVELIRSVGETTLRELKILPVERLRDGTVRAALSNPFDRQVIDDFQALTHLAIGETVVAVQSQINEAIDRVFSKGHVRQDILQESWQAFGGEAAAAAAAVDEERLANLVVQLSQHIIEAAFVRGASDIHVEPRERSVQIRYRVDGACSCAMELPKRAAEPLVNRFKIMADLDISEHRQPQDGRIAFKRFSPQHDVDLRISVAPMQHGEKLCLRILDKTKSTLGLEQLGFSRSNLERYRGVIQAPYGMILHCGPTGSGKSLTLYSALNTINQPDLNISTAEDPIEYTLPGINQMQIRSDIGLTFARALRCFLRQDPDIILVGEIRDEETAEIALEAALTGHLVFSTLHTNDAPATITRLVEMGVPPYMIGTALVCICAQRLARRLCANCRKETSPSDAELDLFRAAGMPDPSETIFAPAGCPRCGQTGYKGRTGIHELLCVDDPLRQLISRNAPVHEIKEAARAAGMRTLFEDAMLKVAEGHLSVAEAIATARPD